MFLGLFLIYWLGKRFYILAEKYNQNKWLFAILGVIVYYFGQFVYGMILVILSEFFHLDIDIDNVGYSLIGIPIGALFCYAFYYFLEKNWQSKQVVPIENIDDIGKDIDEIGV